MKPKASFKTRKSVQGFTLIEIMVVLVILGLLVAAVAPKILGRADQAKVTTTQTNIKTISNALNMYKLDNYNYPSSEQGIEALVNKPSGFPEAKNWNPEGYIDKLPVDGWQREFVYISPGTHGAFDLYSLGADGKEGGEGYDADITSWDR
ncbi:general secretion pathway protein G [Hahella chejuensis KCTC 2396]|uniref:Type II secretion system core protein G n=1 Tax=Hahella chejuensis (strain KCTC 2396) TaxID=349521 RepID=Q2SFB9_HAHCH|nr:type II secretion system major pseudopilin GspG [Hahella chejuensis]ABC30655.1 general secretion pathway protein G [Hahella chejuensis KCTC 2396]